MRSLCSHGSHLVISTSLLNGLHYLHACTIHSASTRHCFAGWTHTCTVPCRIRFEFASLQIRAGCNGGNARTLRIPRCVEKRAHQQSHVLVYRMQRKLKHASVVVIVEACLRLRCTCARRQVRRNERKTGRATETCQHGSRSYARLSRSALERRVACHRRHGNRRIRGSCARGCVVTGTALIVAAGLVLLLPLLGVCVVLLAACMYRVCDVGVTTVAALRCSVAVVVSVVLLVGAAPSCTEVGAAHTEYMTQHACSHLTCRGDEEQHT